MKNFLKHKIKISQPPYSYTICHLLLTLPSCLLEDSSMLCYLEMKTNKEPYFSILSSLILWKSPLYRKTQMWKFSKTFWETCWAFRVARFLVRVGSLNFFLNLPRISYKTSFVFQARGPSRNKLFRVPGHQIPQIHICTAYENDFFVLITCWAKHFIFCLEREKTRVSFV